jgi:hypothetical protein
MVRSYDQPPLPPSFHWWQGRSGRRYIHTIFPINAVPDLWACNYILARPKWDGTREPFYFGQTKTARLGSASRGTRNSRRLSGWRARTACSLPRELASGTPRYRDRSPPRALHSLERAIHPGTGRRLRRSRRASQPIRWNRSPQTSPGAPAI